MVTGPVSILASLLASGPVAAVTVDDLSWLSGRWESLSEDRWVEEIWSLPRGGSLLALSRTGRGERLIEFEFLRVERNFDGRIILSASPQGRTPIPFALTSAEGTEAVFENPLHDFPQRIRYQRTGDRLEAVISDLEGTRIIRWTYDRRP